MSTLISHYLHFENMGVFLKNHDYNPGGPLWKASTVNCGGHGSLGTVLNEVFLKAFEALDPRQFRGGG